MFQFVAIAAALVGGGFLAKKIFGEKKQEQPSFSQMPRSYEPYQPPSVPEMVATPMARAEGMRGAPPLTSQRLDEFLEMRSDGLCQFNRDTAVAILGWLGSVQCVRGPSQWKNAIVYDLVASSDGMPPPVGTGANKMLLAEAKSGKTVLVLKDITKVGVKARRAAAAVGDLLSLAGPDGDYAILMVPLQENVEPKLPSMPGFEGAKRPVPGAMPLPEPSESVGATDELPADVRVLIEDILKKSDGDADALESVSRQLRLGGYIEQAMMLEQKAADIRAQDIVNAVELRTVFVIPKGHRGASSLALQITGNPSRYKELLSSNPELKATKDGRLRPWVPGQIVRLPRSWGA